MSLDVTSATTSRFNTDFNLVVTSGIRSQAEGSDDADVEKVEKSRGERKAKHAR